MKMYRITFFLILLLPLQLFAEKIKLKDGGVVRGKVIEENATELIIANEYGNITIEKSNIKQRIKDSRDSVSFKNSRYSFKKRSWPKYAVLASIGVGIVTTAMLADTYSTGLAPSWISFFSFTGLTLGFAALDYFKYGRVPKRTLRKFSKLQSPLPWGIALQARRRTLNKATPDLAARTEPVWGIKITRPLS